MAAKKTKASAKKPAKLSSKKGASLIEKKPAPPPRPPRQIWIVRFASDDHRVFLFKADAVTCQSIYKGDGPFGPYVLAERKRNG